MVSTFDAGYGVEILAALCVDKTLGDGGDVLGEEIEIGIEEWWIMVLPTKNGPAGGMLAREQAYTLISGIFVVMQLPIS